MEPLEIASKLNPDATKTLNKSRTILMEVAVLNKYWW
jgi:hypothetical protein